MESPDQLSARELSDLLRSNQTTSVDLTRHFLERIETLNGDLHAVISTHPEALQQASLLDEERAAGHLRGPLHGIPVLVKDNIDVTSVPCTAGSIALKNHVPQEDAFLVQRLKAAGCIILGKTNLTEFANFMTIDMPNGYSSLGGQTVNFRLKGQDTGGSSSGSGVAVAAGLAPMAIGTETSGSIIHPANHSGVVGLKPTVGSISRRGVIPISFSQDTAGPMTRTVEDAAMLYQVLAAHDPADPQSRAVGAFRLPEIQPGMRIGVFRESFKLLTEEENGFLEQALQKLTEAGIALVDVEYRHPELSHQWRWEVLTHEFKEGLNKYLSTVTEGPRSMTELIDFYDEHAEEGLRYGQVLLLAANSTTGTLSNPAYNRSRKLDLLYSRDLGIDDLLREHQLEALIYPKWYGYDVPAKAGYPSLTVPVGFREDGMGVNLTFTSTAWTEPLLLSLGLLLEK
ncbi:amidase family protein [Deinococcus cellulosilyticus]|uniref:Amidase n=1 Tax=Deinococcus cellulosilyticus (strain DSM 18568 / NBRC 106333 / KACC 11606 / 5516J-15) TaxID=1223518 RepID=A0A511MX21_DEIC1|nr:amidase family protein [Deinococcus cellulosilyticus]GEM45124.1 amidase [Deinococcus cellulosilyticus NBRC 106333 = KACC 11606]